MSAGKKGDKQGRNREHIARRTLHDLHILYPDAHCELNYSSALELLVATILSAQSTDANVNRVTSELFKKYRTAEDYANADPDIFQQEIRSTGFFRNKTKSVIGAANRIIEDHGGAVPTTMDELITLPGVARKTANVVLGTYFGKAEGFVVDTHVKRVSYRLGLTDEEDPIKIERDLMELFPQEEWIYAGHALIWHGRRLCQARVPRCSACPLNDICLKRGVRAKA